MYVVATDITSLRFVDFRAQQGGPMVEAIKKVFSVVSVSHGGDRKSHMRI